jgi:endogenous inhibitor of DNA gyrase (YacG/DUF329 family)
MESKNKCPTCGDTFSSEFGVKQHHAKSHGESIAGVPVNCENCGNTVRKKSNQVEQWDNHFCGDGCRFEYTRGENHHQYDRVAVDCDNCGKEVKKRPCRIEGREYTFCDMSCRDVFYEESGMFSGEDSPSWKGGSIQPYGCGWLQLRNEIVSEDGCCQSCGSEQQLVAHHIKAVRSFENEEDAHYRENLATLCRTCHPTFEAMEIDKQIERLNIPRLEI